MNDIADRNKQRERSAKRVSDPVSPEAVKDIIKVSQDLQKYIDISSNQQVHIDKLREKNAEMSSQIKELQQYVQEDGDTIEDIIERHNKLTTIIQSLYENLTQIQVMVEKMANKEPEADPEWSILGIEAPKSVWVKILKSVAAAVVLVGVSYYAYKKLNTPVSKAKLAVDMSNPV